LTDALGAHGMALDVGALCTRFGVPVQTPPPEGADGAKPRLELVREAA
jgi:hypothetical protein